MISLEIILNVFKIWQYHFQLKSLFWLTPLHALPLVLLVWRFDSHWWIGPISSITSSNVYNNRINNATQTRNSTALWRLLLYQVTLYYSNILGFQWMSLSNLFPIKIWKSRAICFECGWHDSIIKNYYKSPLKVCELKVRVKYSPRNSPQQSVIAEGFAEANSVFIVITSAKILPRWLFPSKIYIQFTIVEK